MAIQLIRHISQLVLYIAEAVEPKYRGICTASGMAALLGGVWLQTIIGGVFQWRTAAAVSAIVPFVAFCSMFLVPETPYWLYANNRIEAAHRSLQWLRGWVAFEDIEGESKRIVDAVECDKTKSKKHQQKSIRTKLEPFTKRSFIAPFSLALLAYLFSHFTGTTPLGVYSVEIFSAYKVPINAYLATIFLGCAQFIGSMMGMALVRVIGRRKLVFISFIASALCLFFVGSRAQFGSVRHLGSTDASLTTKNVTLAEQHIGAQNVSIMERSFELGVENESFNRWMILILLLTFVMVAHFAAKVLPWMLIGEVCLK